MPLSRPLRRALPLVLGILVIAAACGPGNAMATDDATMVNQLRGATTFDKNVCMTGVNAPCPGVSGNAVPRKPAN